MYNDSDDSFVVLANIIGETGSLIGSVIEKLFYEEIPLHSSSDIPNVSPDIQITSGSQLQNFHIVTNNGTVIVSFLCVADDGHAPRVDFRQIK